MAGVFIDAAEARSRSRQTQEIHAEVTAIEQAILTQVDQGSLEVSIDSGTTMTTSNVYYRSYFGVTNDPASLNQIRYIENYFKNLGYGVSVLENPQTGDTITWNLSW